MEFIADVFPPIERKAWVHILYRVRKLMEQAVPHHVGFGLVFYKVVDAEVNTFPFQIITTTNIVNKMDWNLISELPEPATETIATVFSVGAIL